MKKAILAAVISACLMPCAQAGAFSVAKHVAGDGYHATKYVAVGGAKAVKYTAVGVAKGVKHAGHDAATVAK